MSEAFLSVKSRLFPPGGLFPNNFHGRVDVNWFYFFLFGPILDSSTHIQYVKWYNFS